ncbi:type IV pilus modification PilV family protein [Hydrogenobaculum acidophilum]
MIKAHKHGNLGLTITEVMVSIALLAIGIITFAALQSFFANDTKNRFIYGCLTTVASNGIAMCMSGQPIPSTVKCGGIQVHLNINQSGNIINGNGACSPPTSGCSPITSTASYNNISYRETDNVCAF